MTTNQSITADNYISTIEGFDELPVPLQSDLLALYQLTHGGATVVMPATIASLRTALHIPAHSRLAQHLSEGTRKRTGQRPHYIKLKNGYVLECGYVMQLEQTHLGRPMVRNLASSLRGTLAAISDPAVRSYLEEGISTFEHGHLRSSLILTWCVAYGLLRNWLFRNHLALLNATMGAWKSPIRITRLEDFQELTEATVIDTSRSAKAITKEQAKTLRQLLDQRNSYAHPTAKPITPATVEAYIDTVIREIFTTFG